MYRRIICFLITVVILLAVSVVSYASDDEITLVINGKTIATDVNPVIIDGRTLVPVRVIFDEFGADVTWNDVLRQVVITADSKVMVFTIGSKSCYINGIGFSMDTAPVIINSRTLVPVRFISERLGCDVEWNGSERTVYINRNTKTPQKDPAPVVNDTVSSAVTYDTDLSKIVVSESGDSCYIKVTLSEKIEPKVMRLSNPDRIVFDFYEVNQKCNDGDKSFADSEVVQVRWARHAEFTRIVAENKSSLLYSVGYTSDTCTIRIFKSGNVSENSPSIKDNETQNNTPVVTRPKDAPALVVIDPGHGGRDRGAIGRDEDGEVVVYEADANLAISLKVAALLKQKGIDVIMTRTANVALGDTVMADLVKRAQIANDADADLFVSIHNNAFTDPEATGTSVLYAGLSNNGGYGISSMELAQNIQTPLVKATGLKDRGIVRSPEMVVLKKTAMPAALVECAFVTSLTDQKVLTSEAKLNDIAAAICEGIVKSFKQMGKIK